MSEHAPEQEAAPESGVDLSPLMDRLDEVSSDFGSRLESLEGRLPEPTAEPEPDPWAELIGSPEPEPEEPAVDPRQFVQALQQATQASTQQQVEQIVGPLMSEVQQMRVNQAAQDLETRYPDLKDPEVAASAVEQAMEWAARMGQPGQAPHPALVELAFLASKAQQAAQSEVPADGANVTLEGGGGAPHQSQLTDADVGRRILSAYSGSGNGNGLAW